MGDPLRPLWDFDDLDATEARFRALTAEETDPARRAEVLTQLARIAGLRREFEEGDRLLDDAEAEGAHSVDVRIRVDLERGRLLRSSGDSSAALRHFEAAYGAALEARRAFLAADAAHMAALAADSRDSRTAWAERGLGLAERSPDASYWLGPLLNNLGWEHAEAGDHESALDAFERALAVRERDPDRQDETQIARYAVAKTLLALGRPAEAAAELERAVAWSEAAGRPDGWFHEELAYAYGGLGRAEDARRHARLATQLLGEAGSVVSPRLRELADG